MLRSLILPEALRWQMRAHAGACFPEEACGLIGGVGDQARQVWPVENQLHSPVRFQMTPLSQLKAFLQMEKNGVELLGIFHSHPAGPDIPSQTDIAEFFYPGTPTLILSPTGEPMRNTGENWQIKGFQIENDQAVEIELRFA
jgi:proteasome lid subunit RPN8/RPN11